jgi:hypothetical protein
MDAIPHSRGIRPSHTSQRHPPGVEKGKRKGGERLASHLECAEHEDYSKALACAVIATVGLKHALAELLPQLDGFDVLWRRRDVYVSRGQSLNERKGRGVGSDIQLLPSQLTHIGGCSTLISVTWQFTNAMFPEASGDDKYPGVMRCIVQTYTHEG